MRILLSAYACEPNRGSEPGVGWGWALGLIKEGHDVWVITRKNNRHIIESYLLQSVKMKNLHFIYFDLPLILRWWKKGGRGVRLYYFFWQMGAYLLAKKVHKEVNFECVHHLTFVSIRQPSFMGNLGIPFIFGPVAGGDSVPFRLRFGMGLKGFILDGIRDIVNFMIRFDPFMWMTFIQAKRIIVTSEQTKKLLPNIFQKKTEVQLAIGYDVKDKLPRMKVESKNFGILYVGRFTYLKGMHLGLRAFSQLVEKFPGASLTLVGQGEDEARLKRLSYDLGIDENVKWLPWLSQSELNTVYSKYDVLLFPSLRDSGGMVVLEAMSFGLPVICLGLGGPGSIVDGTCGIVVPGTYTNEKNVINYLFLALHKIMTKPLLRESMASSARKRVQHFRWSHLIKNIYKINE